MATWTEQIVHWLQYISIKHLFSVVRPACPALSSIWMLSRYHCFVDIPEDWTWPFSALYQKQTLKDRVSQLSSKFSGVHFLCHTPVFKQFFCKTRCNSTWFLCLLVKEKRTQLIFNIRNPEGFWVLVIILLRCAMINAMGCIWIKLLLYQMLPIFSKIKQMV